MSRGALLVLLLVFASAGVGCDKLGLGKKQEDRLPSQEQADHKYLVDRLGAVCDGRGYGDAVAQYEPKAGDHPTAVLKQFSGPSASDNWYEVKAPYWPKSFDKTELVACVAAPEGSYGTTGYKIEIRRAHDAALLTTVDASQSKSGGDAQRDEAIANAIAPYAEGKTTLTPPPPSAAIASSSPTAAPSGSVGRLKPPPKKGK